jgi:hypothetical protein
MSNLQKLKRLVQEEYSKYLREQGEFPPLPGGPGLDDPMIAVSDNDIDLTGGDAKESPLDTLKQIFDMLKDFFEGDDKPAAPKGPEGDKEDKPKGNDKPKGEKGGDDKKDDKPKKDKEELKERFQKLANIIK